ncbi:PAS domain-containing sensor histidine kinase [Vibrio sp. VPAP30]|uniref:PAS domain-containing sensor histidine kinase n=1 Tax=Vibrio sp. VPAP30 TaxID=1647102 RepID=UPI0006596CDA|nr:PAS domain-containing sensor histidine kinase [Vibrio sp. VPAP30]KLN66687.1 hypothetical protein ZX61_03275 [Vibrio sp. VPAP30]
MKFANKITLSIVVVSIIGVPALVVGTFYSARELLKNNIANSYLQIAQHQMHSIDRVLYTALRDIKMIAEDENLQDLMQEEWQSTQTFPELIATDWHERTFLTGPWDQLMLVDSFGRILISTDKRAIGRSIEDYPPSNTAFKHTIEGTDYYSDQVLPGEGQRETVIFSAPIRANRGDSTIIGAVIGHFAWPVVAQILDEIAPPVIVDLVNSEGSVIARSNPLLNERSIDRQDATNEFIEAFGKSSKQAGVNNDNNHEYGALLVVFADQNGLFGYKGSGWKLTLKVPLKKALAPVNALARHVTILTVVVMLCVITVLYFVGRLLARPVERLTETIEEVSRGNLSVQADIDTRDEVGTLATSFNRMTEILQRTTVSKDYVDNILKTMPGALFVINPNGVIARANEAALTLLGYQEQALVGQPFSTVVCDPYGKHLEVNDLIRDGVIASNEQRYLDKSRNSIPVLLSGSVMRDDEGRVRNIICIATDIRDRLIYEEKLRKSTSELESTNQALSLAKNQLIHSAKMASIGELSAGLAHEINQPLGAIQLNAELIFSIAEEEEVISREAITPIYTKITGQIQRITKIVQHLRTFSRDEQSVEMEPTDIRLMIEESLILFSQRLRLSNIVLHQDISTVLPSVECCKIQIEQVLTNLLSNAEHAVSKEKNKVIWIRAYTENDCVIIEVEDTGHGISSDNLSRVFDPFFTTKGVGEGTGLGMSISYGIACSHNGRLSVESKLGIGTTFTLSLPIQQNVNVHIDRGKSTVTMGAS